MGSGFSKGVGGFFKGLATGIPTALSGAITGGLDGGPRGAIAGLLGGLIPGVQSGIEGAINAGNDPTGPKSIAEGASMLGQSVLDSGRTIIQRGLMADGGAQGRQVMGRFLGGLTEGQGIRGAAANAGMVPYLRAAGEGAAQGLMNKAQGAAGVSPVTASALGNPILRTMLGRSGTGSTHFQGVRHAIMGSASSLANTVLERTLPQPPQQTPSRDFSDILGPGVPEESSGASGGDGVGQASGSMDIPTGGTDSAVVPGGTGGHATVYG